MQGYGIACTEPIQPGIEKHPRVADNDTDH